MILDSRTIFSKTLHIDPIQVAIVLHPTRGTRAASCDWRPFPVKAFRPEIRLKNSSSTASEVNSSILFGRFPLSARLKFFDCGFLDGEVVPNGLTVRLYRAKETSPNCGTSLS